MSEVRTACQGRKRCDLQASEAVFGKPCAAGINKYLTVTYACGKQRLLFLWLFARCLICVSLFVSGSPFFVLSAGLL